MGSEPEYYDLTHIVGAEWPCEYVEYTLSGNNRLKMVGSAI